MCLFLFEHAHVGQAGEAAAVKVHVQIHGRAAFELRRQVDVANLLPRVIEVVAVDVEKRVERRVEPLAGLNGGRHDPVLPVDDDLDGVPAIAGAVVDGEPVAAKLKRIDGRRRRARQAQRQTRTRGGQAYRRAQTRRPPPVPPAKMHGP